jgi:hypothetical protein
MVGKLFVLLLGACGLQMAWAARPFVTDDARLTTAGSCQLETWLRSYRNSTEAWFLPACNPSGNFEITAGVGRNYQGQGDSSDYIVQLKTLLKPLKPNGVGVGFALGQVSHPSVYPGPNLFGNRYAYVPVSVSLLDDQLILHTNLGLIQDKLSHRSTQTFGVGAELALKPRWLGIAELYGDQRGARFYQAGVRYSVIPDLFQLDATVGGKPEGAAESRWLSVGIRYTPDRLF